MIFNYKDWWEWVFYSIFIYCVILIITNLNTLVRWKWGYYSLDLIPPFLLLIILGLVNHFIRHKRYEKYVEERFEDLKQQEQKDE
jgi:hypothetical protein